MLLIEIAALLIAGMFIESVVIILLFTSILLPMVVKVGVDPVHFGLVMIIMCVMGPVTPPVGVSMFTVCSILDCPVEEYIKESIPFLVAVLLWVIILIFLPQIVLFLPNLIFGKD